MTNWSIVCDDILNWCEAYKGEPFHAALLDPPYHLKGGFMSKAWDKDGPDAIAFQPETWAAIADHLYPGAFLMAFGGSRTHHRMAIAMEDAGLVLHPTMVWLNGQSFPKATRIDTQIDKAAGAEREVVGKKRAGYGKRNGVKDEHGGIFLNSLPEELKQVHITAPATPLAATWAGHRYGLQALKPCAEFILCAQKPYSGRPVDSIVATGAGSLWIDGGRVATGESIAAHRNTARNEVYGKFNEAYQQGDNGKYVNSQGRWPPNVTLSHIPGHHTCDGCGFVAWAAHDECPACLQSAGWTDHEGCRRVGTKRVQTKDGNGQNNVGEFGAFDTGEIYGTGQGVNEQTRRYVSDGLEAVEDWQCVEGCPVRELGEQSGERPSGSGIKTLKGSVIGNGNTHGRMVSGYDNPGTGGDTGTAARFYPQSDWQYEIEERLAGVTPFMYQSKASRGERDSGLDSGEIVMVQLHQENESSGGVTWENEAQQVKLLVDTAQSQPKVIAASTSEKLNATEWNTFLFGNGTTDQSLMATTSITLTGTNSITESKTLSWLIRSLTNACTQDVNLETGNGGSPAVNAELCNPSLSFTNVETVYLPGVGNVASGTQWTISASDAFGANRGEITLGNQNKICKDCGCRQFGEPNKPACICDSPNWREPKNIKARNGHPTIKPIALTKWLATLLLPPPEYAPRRLLVPFGGVMSEAIGGILAGWDEVVAIEMEEEYIPIGEARLRFWAGWSERGHDDPKEILKQAAKEKRKEPEPQIEMDLS